MLKFALNHSFFTFGVLLATLIISIGAFQGGVIKSTFFPIIERDNVTINLQMPAGTRENITQKWLDHIEAAAVDANKELSQRFFNNEQQAIIQFEKNLGPTSYQGNVNITMLDSELRDSLRMRDVINAVREKTGTIYDAEVLTFGAQSPFGKPINISLVGENLEELSKATQAVKIELSKLEELRDVVDNNQPGLREINVELKDKAYFLGLDLRQIISQVRSGFFGNEVQRLQRGRDEVKVWVRYAEEDRKDVTQLEVMRLRFVDGREFQVSEIADLELQRGVININHLNAKREVRIEADVANDKVSVSDLTANIKSTIVPEVLKEFPSVRPIFEGQNREQEKTQCPSMSL
ncbi:MAG: efflux RND transporter permease subunit, partial [Saprospiraceae bacterium]|nr:efflux RND transporter permease subunit [Saprospiraceae bacterium]